MVGSIATPTVGCCPEKMDGGEDVSVASLESNDIERSRVDRQCVKQSDKFIMTLIPQSCISGLDLPRSFLTLFSTAHPTSRFHFFLKEIPSYKQANNGHASRTPNTCYWIFLGHIALYLARRAQDAPLYSATLGTITHKCGHCPIMDVDHCMRVYPTISSLGLLSAGPYQSHQVCTSVVGLRAGLYS